MKKLSKEETGRLGLYEFQGYIGAMTSPTFGGWRGTDRLLSLLSIGEMKKPKILEVGCCTGYVTRRVAQRFDCEIIGVDLSPLLLDIAEEESRRLKLHNVSFICADVVALPFPDNLFDVVYGEAITALVPDPARVLSEYERVLRPGGKVATLDLFRKESLSEDLLAETNRLMSGVIGTQIRLRDLTQWEQLFRESRFGSIAVYDYYEDLFVRDYSPGKRLQLILRLLYHVTVNKEIRKKIVPPMKFAGAFQRALKGGGFGYFIFTGVKEPAYREEPSWTPAHV